MAKNSLETLRSESPVMALARLLGFDSFAWALRRFHCPVGPEALVLEVGSGGNPYSRSNVLLDAYENTRERHWAPLSADRPTVLGFVENLPFRDKVFDFVIAAHVLEHSAEPDHFLSELQRVAHAGYIEVPDAFMERVNPYRDHRLEITVRDQVLVIRKKNDWVHDKEVVELYEHRVKPLMTRSLIPQNPFDFHVRHYWQNRIAFTVINPEVDAGWTPPTVGNNNSGAMGTASIRSQVRDLLRGLLSQRSRNRNIDLMLLMRCTLCKGERLNKDGDRICCSDCGSRFPVRRGIPVMNEPESGE